MDCLPHEILTSIAAYLPTAIDVCRFRLLERRCASAAFPVLFSHVRVLNTLECLHDVQQIVQSPYGSAGFTKSLSLYHAAWPSVTSFSAWRNHPLALRSESNFMHAFQEYRRFDLAESSRLFEDDVAELCDLLLQFPRLEELRIADVHTQDQLSLRDNHYNKLINRIRMISTFHGDMSNLFLQTSGVFNSMHCLTTLSLAGWMDTRRLSLIEPFPRINTLQLTSLLLNDESDQSVCYFLSLFPNLREIALRAVPVGRLQDRTLPLASLNWRDLQHARLSGVCVTEDDLINFVCRHQLRSLSLMDVMLEQGSWESFFSRLRHQVSDIQFDGEGTFTAVYSQTYNLDLFSLRLIRLFLAARNFPWPFTAWAC